ncbi:heme NO-binding domain-containing protein [Haloarchaeobius sp. HRN-SO-5]|uniref:heme NO-binding domain-containing protein n=1 Tax=Haloarchaeobius sp. HRN-SO-5 TaxID=3446118 RepID=UPI003EB912DD
MHGLLHKSLKQYVGERVERTTWDDVLAGAGIEPKLYLPVTRYPDEEYTGVVTVLAEETGRTEAAVERDVGGHLAPDLLDTFKAHVKSGWGAREVVSNLHAIYSQIEAESDDPSYPTISAERVDDDECVLEYQSDLGLCDLLEGVVEGVATEFETEARVTERACTHDGADHCELTVEFV